MRIDSGLDSLRGKRVLCAVSGGGDSMCLLHLLYSAGISVAAAHYEHGIRGEESLRDARFVEDYCREKGIDCFLGHGDVPARARETGMGIEECARELRYAFLRETARERGYELIATAHNADDNVETLILNLCRGAGAAGLRGIPQSRGNIVRPLLTVTRREIELYLEANGVPHVEDGSNADDRYRRNLVRHRVLPALREINPELAAAAGRTAQLMGQDDDCLCDMAGDFLARRFDGESLPTGELLSLHPAVAARVVRALAKRSLSYQHVQSVLAICRSEEPAFADVPGQRFRVERGRLWLSEDKAAALGSYELLPGQTLRIPEAGLAVSAEIAVYGGEINDLFKTYYLKYENIGSTVQITGRRPGDRLRPQGRGVTKTLKQLFAEAGYTADMREATPVFRDGVGPLAVYGLAVDQRLKPAPGDRVLRLEIKKEYMGENV